jgi:uncharacterized protein (UPF0276 family)
MFEHIPVLGAGLGYQDLLHDEILAHRDRIDFLEVPSDQFMGQMPEWTDRLMDLKRNFPTVAHGIYMSLGDASGAHLAYLERLAPFIDALDPLVFSDHVDMGNLPDHALGRYFHGMQVPFTREQATVFRRNMEVFAGRIRRPLLVENIFYKFVLPMPDDLPEPVFIDEILRDTDHGLLLDVTNLHINAMNLGFDPYAWLEQAPLERTVYIHVAGGEKRVGGLWDGRWVDTHSQPVPDEVWRMVELVAGQAPVKGILLERDQNYPPLSDMLAELAIARSILAGAGLTSEGQTIAAAEAAVEH